MKDGTRSSMFIIFWKTLRKFDFSGARLFFIALLGVISSGLAAVVPLLLGMLVDEIVAYLKVGESARSSAGSIRLVCLLFAGMLIRDAVRIFYGFEVTRLTNSLVVRVRREISQRALTSSSKSKRDKPVEASYVLSSDVQQLGLLYSHPLTTVIADLLDTFFMSIAIALISWELLGIVALPLVPIFWISSWAGKRQKRFAEAIRNEEVNSARLLDSALRNIITVRVFGGLPRELRFLRTKFDALKKALVASNYNLVLLMALIGLLRIGATILGMLYAIFAVGLGKIEVGSIAVLMMYLTRYYSPAINLSKAYQSMQRGAVSAQRIMKYIDDFAPLSLESYSCAVSASPVAFRIANVVVELPDGRILKVPDFSISRKGLVVVLGDSGVGKSSFLRGLLGVNDGKLVGDVQVWDSRGRRYVGASRVTAFSYAGQDDELIGATIGDAVSYPDSGESADQGRVSRLLKQLGVLSLEGRSLEEDVQPLSGGEARRVVLARALYRPAPILLADEVTSNLDASSKQIVEDVLLEECRHRIVILVAHNPSRALLDSAAFVLRLECGVSESSVGDVG